jgi:hypothetical protein
MIAKFWMNWLSAVSVILILAGLVFAFFGLRILPVEQSVLLQWQSAIYGSIMIGWGTTLLFVGREAFHAHSRTLLRALAYGLAVWLITEAAFSVYWRVWFNVGVDVAVLTLFLIPLRRGVQAEKTAPPNMKQKGD